MKLTLLVLAAGLGSRYGSLKQLEPFGPNGETLLEISIKDAIKAGFSKVVFVIRRDFSNEFREKIGNNFQYLIEVVYAYQELNDIPEKFNVLPKREKPWGTGHAIRAARSLIAEAFAVINADDYYGEDAYSQAALKIRESSETGKRVFGLVAYPLANTLSPNGSVNRGICESSNKQLLSVQEHLRIQKNREGIIEGLDPSGQIVTLAEDKDTSMNFWLFDQSLFAELETQFTEFLEVHGRDPNSEFYIPSVVDFLIKQKNWQCEIMQTSGSWFGITYPADKAEVRERLAKLLTSKG